MSFTILLFGIIAFTRLPVREYPDIDPPIISVVTFYRGASPSVVETEITNVLEEQFATLEGVKTMTSSSREQGSVITIEFELNRNVDEAANDVRDRVSRVRGNLPREIDDPVISKVDANAQPIVWLALSSERHNGLELTDVADRILKERIQRLPGVGSVIIGGRTPVRHARLARSAAHGGPRTDDAGCRSGGPAGECGDSRRQGGGCRAGVLRPHARRALNTPEEFGAIIVSQTRRRHRALARHRRGERGRRR